MAIEYGDKCYRIVDVLPKNEQFGLASQLRRAALSISSNIAEGSGSATTKDFSNFLDISIKSALETVSLLAFASKQKYIAEEIRQERYQEAEILVKKIHSFKQSLNNTKPLVTSHLSRADNNIVKPPATRHELRADRGFTAIEMLLVVAFVIILLAISTISLRDQGPKNRNAERKNEVNAIKDALTQWSLDAGRYMLPGVPATPTCIGTRGEKWLWSSNSDTFIGEDPQSDGVNDPDITVDVTGNIYTVWRSDYDLYAQKFDANKNPLWGANGVRVNQTTTGNQGGSSINVDSIGNLYVAWQDSRSGIEIYAQKLNSAGVAQWGASDKRVNQITTNDQIEPSTAVDGVGNFYVVWGDRRDQASSGWDIYAQKLDSAGNFLWGVNDIKVNKNNDTANQREPSTSIDSTNNLYIAWTDARNGPSNQDIYMQKLNSSDGSAIWSQNDVKVNQNSDVAEQREPAVAVDSGGSIYAAWEDDRNNTLIYAQKLNSSGIAQWGVQDLKIPQGPTTSAGFPGIATGSNGDIYIAWVDADRDAEDEDGNPYDIFAQRITSSADILWGSQDKKINYWNEQMMDPTRGTQIAVDPSGNLYVTWFDYLSANSGTLTQELDARGGCYDLILYLMPDKLETIPEDPKNTNGQADTGYTIYKDATTKEIIIGAPMAENGETIEARRK